MFPKLMVAPASHHLRSTPQLVPVQHERSQMFPRGELWCD